MEAVTDADVFLSVCRLKISPVAVFPMFDGERVCTQVRFAHAPLPPHPAHAVRYSSELARSRMSDDRSSSGGLREGHSRMQTAGRERCTPQRQGSRRRGLRGIWGAHAHACLWRGSQMRGHCAAVCMLLTVFCSACVAASALGACDSLHRAICCLPSRPILPLPCRRTQGGRTGARAAAVLVVRGRSRWLCCCWRSSLRRSACGHAHLAITTQTVIRAPRDSFATVLLGQLWIALSTRIMGEISRPPSRTASHARRDTSTAQTQTQASQASRMRAHSGQGTCK